MHPLIEKTWQEIGFRVRPLRRLVYIRTEQRPYKSHGGIWFPPSSADFFARDKAKIDVEIYARVLAVGPQVRFVKPGDRIFISRLYFAWLRKLEDGNFMGYVDEDNVFGFAAEDEVKEEDREKIGASSQDQRQGASLG